jgi:hypothetical protein
MSKKYGVTEIYVKEMSMCDEDKELGSCNSMKLIGSVSIDSCFIKDKVSKLILFLNETILLIMQCN